MHKYTLIIDQRTVKKLVSMTDAIKAIEKGFKDHGLGKTLMPPKVYIDLKKHRGDFRAMPVYDEGFKKCAIKWVNVHPDNKKKGLPTVMGIMILSDPLTGFPLAIMDATGATALRTGAAGGVAAKYLARRDSKIVSLVGAGVQARSQLMAIKEVLKIEEVKVWGRRGEAKEFTENIRIKGVRVVASGNLEDCVRGSDIVVTTTPSRKPIVKDAWLKEGAHINAIGADARGKQELEPSILKRSRLVVDSWEQASHSGEINMPLKKGIISQKDIYADMGEISAGKKKVRRTKKEITVFDSTGLAVQDLAIADLIYRKALASGKGKKICFI